MSHDLLLKHLEMIQGVISRMANNSFLLKGWTLTLVAAVLALGEKSGDARQGIAMLAVLPVLLFWVLDGYFLYQERLFRKLYDAARVKRCSEVDLVISTAGLGNMGEALSALCAPTQLLYYLTLGALAAVIACKF